MVDKAEASTNVEEIYKNQAAQHRYMSWRSAKVEMLSLLILHDRVNINLQA